MYYLLTSKAEPHINQLLDEVKQNVVPVSISYICQWRADQLFADGERQRQIIDLRATDKYGPLLPPKMLF